MTNARKWFPPVVLVAVFFSIFVPLQQVVAIEESVTITQGITGAVSVCGNGICESGETSASCPADCPVEVVPTPRPPSGILDIFPPRITDIKVQPSSNSAIISWKTLEPALSKLFWGKTQEYEEGTIAEASFSTEHSAFLAGLLPDTFYHFQIEARDARGNTARTGDRTFRTLSPPDTTPPANVSSFEAISGDRQITLQWKNPPDKDFQAVKIQRSTFFYPQDPFDGETVYNSTGETFVDIGLQNGVRYYYTAFAYDTSGNYASGAVASAIPGVIAPPPEVFPPPTELLPPELKKLTLEDFDFWEEGRKLPIENGRLVRVKIGLPLTVSIDYEKVPEVLKTIMITLEQPEQLAEQTRGSTSGQLGQEAFAATKTFSFLLRINQQKTRYEATLMPPEEELLYPMFINVMDFKHQALKRLEGEMQTIAPPPPPPIPWYKQARNWRYLLYILLALLMVWHLVGRRIQRKIAEMREKKSEIRNTKFETNPNDQNPKPKTMDEKSETG